MRLRGSLLALALLAVLAACGDPTTVRTPSSTAKYEVSATVLESPEHGPAICVGVMLTSLPPQCGDVPIANWDWAKVDGEERVGGTIWGEYHVIGTFDGTVFTLTDPPGPPVRQEPEDPDFTTPCKKPLPQPDPSKTSQEDFDAAVSAAQRAPDFAAVWIDAPVIGSGDAGYQDTKNAVLNVGFTGNLEAHEAELREYWGGSLCVIKKDRTSAELRQIQNELHEVARDLGMKLLSVGAREHLGDVELTVVFGDEQDQAALDARYGKGLVKLISRLKPVA